MTQTIDKKIIDQVKGVFTRARVVKQNCHLNKNYRLWCKRENDLAPNEVTYCWKLFYHPSCEKGFKQVGGERFQKSRAGQAAAIGAMIGHIGLLTAQEAK